MIDSNQVHNTYSDKELFHDRLVIYFEKQAFENATNSLGIDLDEFLQEHRGLIQIPQGDRALVESFLIALAEELEQKQVLYQTIVKLKFAELITYLIRLKISGAMHALPTVSEIEMNDKNNN